MKSVAVLFAVTTFIANAGVSIALPAARNVSAKEAQAINNRGIELKVWRGYGLTINFIPTGEIIKQVWLGDPSRFALTSNGSLCQRGSNDENCGVGGATVLFIRQVKPINFPSLTASQDGSTVITIITSGEGGQKHYQFKLTPAGGKPQYTSLIINPDVIPKTILVDNPRINSKIAQTNQSERNYNNSVVNVNSDGGGEDDKKENTRLQRVNRNTSNNKNENSVQQVSNSSIQLPENKINLSNSNIDNTLVGTRLKRNDANAVAYGLGIAINKGVVKIKSREWARAQDTIRLLRRGKTRVEAVKLSGIPQELFDKLIKWGQN